MNASNGIESDPDSPSPNGIAVVGMAGRFPGANSVSALWNNLRDGHESIATLSEETLLASGVGEKALANAAYVRRAPLVDGVDEFDADFFGFSPHSARTMDPQHRLFLQCAWHAFEDAGFDPAAFDGAIGVYGTSASPGLSGPQPSVAARPEHDHRSGRESRTTQPLLADRQGFSRHPGVAPVRPSGSRHHRSNGLFVIACRGALGLPEPVERGMRHRPRRRGVASGPAPGRLLARSWVDGVGRRTLPAV